MSQENTVAQIKYVKYLAAKRDYQVVSHDDLDDWLHSDFIKHGMFESLLNQEYVHLYFDFDFHTGDEIITNVKRIFDLLDNFKNVFGEYAFAGYCCDKEIYNQLDQEFKDRIELKTFNLEKPLSFHVVFYKSRILQNELCEIMTSKKYSHEIKQFADSKVYKNKDKEQLLRHPYANKYIKTNERNDNELKGVNFDDLENPFMQSELVATPQGFEKIIQKDQWSILFNEIDESNEIESEEDIQIVNRFNTTMTKELFETLYKGFKGLEIHGDSEKADKEITLFPLFSALLKCINDVDVNENDFNKACYYIYYNAELTTKAKEKWDSKLEQAKEKKESCFGPGALFTYIKLFNLEYYNKFIVPMVRKERMSDEIKFDLRDSFCLKDIREKGANNKYQIDGDASKLNYNAVINDLRRVLVIVDKANTIYIFKERDSRNDKMNITSCSLKSAKDTLKQLKIGTEQKKDKIITRSAWDVFDASTNNAIFYKRDITFYSEHKDDFSFYQGLKYDNERNDHLIEMFNNHILNIWCKGNKELYEYIQSWFATIYQNPLGRAHTALVLKGKEGSGKNVITDTWCELLAGYANSNVSDIDSIVGKFNSSVENKKLLVCNEMDSAEMNSTAVFNRLKKLITENSVDIQTKNVSVRDGVQNVSNFIFISNESNPIKISSSDRRYCVLTPSEEVINNRKYFNALFGLMMDRNQNYKKEFMQALSYYYMNYEVKINLLDIPETVERIIAKEANKSTIELFVDEYCVELSGDGLLPDDAFDYYNIFAAKNNCTSRYKKATFRAEMLRFCAYDKDGKLHRYKKRRVYRFTDENIDRFSELVKEKLAESCDITDDDDIPVRMRE